MPSELLTNEGLNTLLSDFIESLNHIDYSSTYALFNTLFQHGFRVRELRNLHTWTINEFDQVVATTSKGGNNRLIDVADLHPLVISSIIAETNFVFVSSYDYYKNYFQRHIGVLDLTTNWKSLSTHAFRHNKIKQLDEAEFTTAQIKEITGILHDSTVTGYINSQIYKHTH